MNSQRPAAREAVDQLLGQRPHRRSQRLDRARRERPAHELAQPRVILAVDREERARQQLVDRARPCSPCRRTIARSELSSRGSASRACDLRVRHDHGADRRARQAALLPHRVDRGPGSASNSGERKSRNGASSRVFTARSIGSCAARARPALPAAAPRDSARVEGALEGRPLARVEGRARRRVVVAVARGSPPAARPAAARARPSRGSRARSRWGTARRDRAARGAPSHLARGSSMPTSAARAGGGVAEAGRVPDAPLAHLADAVHRAEEVDQQRGVPAHEGGDLPEARLRRRLAPVEHGRQLGEEPRAAEAAAADDDAVAAGRRAACAARPSTPRRRRCRARGCRTARLERRDRRPSRRRRRRAAPRCARAARWRPRPRPRRRARRRGR